MTNLTSICLLNVRSELDVCSLLYASRMKGHHLPGVVERRQIVRTEVCFFYKELHTWWYDKTVFYKLPI